MGIFKKVEELEKAADFLKEADLKKNASTTRVRKKETKPTLQYIFPKKKKRK